VVEQILATLSDQERGKVL